MFIVSNEISVEEASVSFTQLETRMLQQSPARLAVIKSISGCVRIACAELTQGIQWFNFSLIMRSPLA